MSDNRLKALVVVAVIITFFVGVGVGSSGSKASATPPPAKTITQTVTKTVTPASCTDVIDLDNQIFIKVGQALNDWPDTTALESATQFITDNTTGRTAAVATCEAAS